MATVELPPVPGASSVVPPPVGSSTASLGGTHARQRTSMLGKTTRTVRNWTAFVANALFQRKRTFFPDAESKTMKLSFGQKIAYALPQFSLTSVTMLIGIHNTVFYTKIGASVAFLAFFTALARSFDVVTDPLMGWISDSTRSSHGRRRPWMLTGCWAYALLFILLMSPPESLTGTQVSLWFGFTYILLYLGDTVSNVPYGALGPEMTDDPLERNSLFFWAKLINGIGVLTGAVGPVIASIMYQSSLPECECDVECNAVSYATPPASNTSYPLSWYNETTCLGGADDWSSHAFSYCDCHQVCDGICDVSASRNAMSTMAWIFGLWYIVAVLVCVGRIKERKVDPEAPTKKSAPLIPSLLATLRNKPFVGLLPAWVCDMCAYTMLGTMLPFYMEYVIRPGSVPECADGKRAILGLDNWFETKQEMWCKTEAWLGMGLVSLIVAQIVSMPLWLLATKKFGKYRTWLYFNLFTAITNGAFCFIGRGDPKWGMILAFCNGLPSGAQFLTDSIVADVIDYDEFLTGQRSEARFTIFSTFIPKIVSIPAQAIPLALLTAFGFIAPDARGVPQEQSSGVIIYIQVVFFVLPFCLAVCSFLIKRHFPIRTPKITMDIVKGAALHMEGEKALDPLKKRMVGLFEYENEEEEEDVCRLDCFFLPQLKRLRDGATDVVAGAKTLCTAMLKTIYICISVAMFGLVLVVLSMVSITDPVSDDGECTWGEKEPGACAESWIEWPAMSWLPAFAVIATGMGTSCALFNYVRLRTARSLVSKPVTKSLLTRWISFLEGTEEEEDWMAGIGCPACQCAEGYVEGEPCPECGYDGSVTAGEDDAVCELTDLEVITVEEDDDDEDEGQAGVMEQPIVAPEDVILSARAQTALDALEVVPQEKVALASLFTTWGTRNWFWDGIVAEKGHVVELQLSGAGRHESQKLTGRITPAIGRLQSLRRVYLPSNRLVGDVSLAFRGGSQYFELVDLSGNDVWDSQHGSADWEDPQAIARYYSSRDYCFRLLGMDLYAGCVNRNEFILSTIITSFVGQVDVLYDLYIAYLLFSRGDVGWGWTSLSFILLPCLFTAIFIDDSVSDRTLTAFQLRNLIEMFRSLNRKESDPSDPWGLKQRFANTLTLGLMYQRVVTTLLESAPQTVFQIFIVLNDSDGYYDSYIITSVVFSALSVAVGIWRYGRAYYVLRRTQEGCPIVSWSLMSCLANGVSVMWRALAMALLAYSVSAWVFPIAILFVGLRVLMWKTVSAPSLRRWPVCIFGTVTDTVWDAKRHFVIASVLSSVESIGAVVVWWLLEGADEGLEDSRNFVILIAAASLFVLHILFHVCITYRLLYVLGAHADSQELLAGHCRVLPVQYRARKRKALRLTKNLSLPLEAGLSVIGEMPADRGIEMIQDLFGASRVETRALWGLFEAWGKAPWFWQGVRMSEAGHVVGLGLRGAGKDQPLRGKIPECISGLHMLRALLLQDNKLTGDVPYAVGALRRMKLLDLSGNPDIIAPPGVDFHFRADSARFYVKRTRAAQLLNMNIECKRMVQTPAEMFVLIMGTLMGYWSVIGDVLVAAMLFDRGDLGWFYVTVMLIIMPPLITAIGVDHQPFDKFLTLTKLRLLVEAWKSMRRGVQSVGFQFVKLVEGVLESAPQTMLQLYVLLWLWEQDEAHSSLLSLVLLFSIGAKVLSLSWTVTLYMDNVEALVKPGRWTPSEDGVMRFIPMKGYRFAKALVKCCPFIGTVEDTTRTLYQLSLALFHMVEVSWRLFTAALIARYLRAWTFGLLLGILCLRFGMWVIVGGGSNKDPLISFIASVLDSAWDTKQHVLTGTILSLLEGIAYTCVWVAWSGSSLSILNTVVIAGVLGLTRTLLCLIVPSRLNGRIE